MPVTGKLFCKPIIKLVRTYFKIALLIADARMIASVRGLKILLQADATNPIVLELKHKLLIQLLSV